jgi:hypothetical protein
MPQASPSDPLFATRWVHVTEQDTAEGAVFLPEDADIPLSRRPRAQLRLAPDGTGTWYEPGADDRPVGRPIVWNENPDGVVVARTPAGESLRVVSRAPDRLVLTGLPR